RFILRVALPPAAWARSSRHEYHPDFLRRLARPRRHPGLPTHPRRPGPAPGRLPLPPAPGRGLLLPPTTVPPPTPLRDRTQGGPGRTADRLQPLRRLQAPRAFLQGSHSGGPPPPSRPAARQAPAALRRPGRPVPRRPPPGHPLRHPGLPAADVRRPHFAPGAAHLPAHLRPGPRRPTGHARRGQPPPGGGPPRPPPPPPRLPTRPARARPARPAAPPGPALGPHSVCGRLPPAAPSPPLAGHRPRLLTR